MINILYIIDHIWNSNGGTEGQLLMLLNNLDPEKYRVHLFCLKETPWSKNTKPPFPTTVLNIHRLVTPGIIGKLAFVRRYCRQNKIDIIQTYFNDSLIFGVMAGRFSGVKRIIACRRNLGPGFWGRKNLLRAFRAVRRFVTRYMANSQATRESIAFYESIDPSKIDVIYNGLDLTRFSAINNGLRDKTRLNLGIDNGQVLIGMVAHLRKEKNLDLFIEAARQLAPQYPEARYILLGDGRDRPALERQVRKLGLDKILSAGGQPDGCCSLPGRYGYCLFDIGRRELFQCHYRIYGGRLAGRSHGRGRQYRSYTIPGISFPAWRPGKVQSPPGSPDRG